MRRWLIILVLIIGGRIGAQVRTEHTEKELALTAADSVLWLGDDFIDPASLSLTIDGSVRLIPDQDYQYHTIERTVILTSRLRDLLFKSDVDSFGRTYTLTAAYKRYSIGLNRTYSYFDTSVQYHQRETLHDSSHSVISVSSPISTIEKYGGITRGISVGSDQEAVTTSSFNIVFRGDIDSVFTVSGALSEESAAIQPEGNTQLLRDIDRIFVSMKYKDAAGITLGDITHTFASASTDNVGSPILRLTRKGLGADFLYDNKRQKASAGVSTPRGSFATNTFGGIIGYQGPYRLQGKNGERNILIVAGTERVTVDGVVMTRGENADYRIDYSTGEIYFMPRRYIDQYSRIAVDFEYTSESYSRSLVSSTAGTALLNDHLRVGVSYIRQADDPDATRYFTLTDSDKNTLMSAGYANRAASRSGVRYVGRDSAGRARGTYVRVDSAGTIYRFQPSDTLNAVYNITFGYVGSGGNYRRATTLEYEFVGNGRGDYDTLIYLPMPALQQAFGTSASIRLFDSTLRLSGEFVRSSIVPNRFASLGGIDGNAYQASIVFHDSALIASSVLTADLRMRRQDSLFTSPERLLEPDALRRYGVDDTSDVFSSYITNDLLEQNAAVHLVSDRLLIGGSYGRVSSVRRDIEAENITGRFDLYERDSWLPTLITSHQYIPSHRRKGNEQSTWHITSAALSRTVGIDSLRLVPQIRYNRTDKREDHSGVENDRSYLYNELSGGLQLHARSLSALLQLSHFTDDSSRAGEYRRVSNNYRWLASTTINSGRLFSLNADLSLVTKRYADSLTRIRNGGDRTILSAQIVPRLVLAGGGVSTDLRYVLLNELSSRTERIFFETQPGFGTYRYLGDLNGNNIKDPNEFELARYGDQANYVLITRPSEMLYPTTNVNTAVRVQIKPSAFLEQGSFLTWLTSETQLRIDEKSRAARSSDVYLLKPSHLLNDTTTIEGRIEWMQEFAVLENDPAKHFRIRYDRRTSLANYTTGAEHRFSESISLRSHIQLFPSLSAEHLLRAITDKIEASQTSLYRSGDIRQYGTELELRYMPLFTATTVSLKSSYFSTKNTSTSDRSTLTTAIIRITHRPIDVFGITIEAGGANLSIVSENTYFLLPYQLTDGRDPGTTIQWSASAEYQIAEGLSAVVDYRGRHNKTAVLGEPTVHTVRMDFRATF